MTAPAARRARIPEGTAIVVRDEHQLQIGTDPERSLLVDLPPTLDAREVCRALRSLDDPAQGPRLRRQLCAAGLSSPDLDRIVARLRGLRTESPPRPALRVCLHGAGPLNTGLAAALAEAGHPVVRSKARRARPWQIGPPRPTLVVLTDFTHPDPLVVADLMRHGVPHLPVFLREGVGVVGPLVLPGRSSCLRCADHHRTVLDPLWPVVCAQLVNRPGYAGDAITRLTVGTALEQIEQINLGIGPDGGGRTPRPDLVDTTLEIHPRPVRLRRKDWSVHPDCGCGARWT
ncbi:hypothetical protein HUN08_13390 [Gordonia sp. X0973]|uniref:hypothetical protein n=1 Tax=Gordonia sp. X0973 TaxID=2742602 RepID=UPI000F54C323|nr:hypothetical protein [Gordonia sp. X0973]QKT08068.1 hypothetical protein HUN08_13390 [Gordonia sp. X0973]